jgi:hypothetical protein
MSCADADRWASDKGVKIRYMGIYESHKIEIMQGLERNSGWQETRREQDNFIWAWGL